LDWYLYVLLLCFPLAFGFAQRRFTALAIRARPSGDMFRFFIAGLDGADVPAFFFGLPQPTTGKLRKYPRPQAETEPVAGMQFPHQSKLTMTFSAIGAGI
jgi:hypothetical protein